MDAVEFLVVGEGSHYVAVRQHVEAVAEVAAAVRVERDGVVLIGELAGYGSVDRGQRALPCAALLRCAQGGEWAVQVEFALNRVQVAA